MLNVILLVFLNFVVLCLNQNDNNILINVLIWEQIRSLKSLRADG